METQDLSSTDLKETLDKYSNVDSFVVALRLLVEENWRMNKEIIFINQIEYSELIKKNNPTKKAGIPMSILNFSVNVKGIQKSSNNTTVIDPNSISANRLSSKGYSFNTTLHTGNCGLGEILLGLLELQNGIQLCLDDISNKERRDYAFKKNSDQFKNRTLLILKEDIVEGLTEDEIKAEYKYAFKIVERAELNQILLTKDETMLFVSVIYGDSGIPCHAIFLVNNGEPANLIFNVVTKPGLPNPLSKIRKQHFDRYTKRE